MSLHSGFLPKVEIEDEAFLFGHKNSGGLLDRFCMQVRIGSNTQLLGERNSGKTSLLRCARARRLRKDDGDILPVFVPFETTLETWADAYRWFLAAIHAELAHSGGNVDFEVGGVNLGSETEETANILHRLRGVTDDLIKPAWTAYFRQLAVRRRGVVLLIDEWEHFLNRAFEGDVLRFWDLRTTATQPCGEKTARPLTVVLAGKSEWSSRCRGLPAGSPALNFVTNTEYVEPLGHSDFLRMWQACLNESDSDLQVRLRGAIPDISRVYELAGGWPYLGKLIGQQMVTATALDELQLLEQVESHFNEVWKSRTEEERQKLLAALAGAVHDCDNVLKRRGLIELDASNRPRPRGRLLAMYLEQRRGSSPADDATFQEQEPYIFCLEGEMYYIRFEDKHGRFPQRQGLRIIHRQLQDPNPSKTKSAIEILQRSEETKGAEQSHTPTMDQPAIKASIDEWRRLKDLRTVEAVDEAEEIEKRLRDSVKNPKDFPFDGRKAQPKACGVTNEKRAKNLISHNLETAYKMLGRTLPELVKHLKRFMRPQDTWSYRPSPEIRWKHD